MNLLQETKEKLKDNGKSFLDIEWVGCNEFRISMEDFMRLADVEYDEGFGRQWVAKDLIMVGEDFALIRDSYDGSESWHMVTTTPPEQIRSVTSLISEEGWETLAEINKEEIY